MVKRKLSGNLLVSIAALLWGTSFVAIQWGFNESEIDPLVFVFLRFGIATVVFLPISYCFIKDKMKLLRRKEIVLIGLFNSIAFLLQFLGQQYTTAGKASLFVNFYAIIVPLLAPIILPEKYSWKVIIGSIIGFTGAFFVTTNLNFTEFQVGSFVGDLLTLGSGVAWTLYIIASKKLLERDNQISGLDTFFGTIVWTTIFLTITIPFVFINNTWSEIVSGFNWQSIVAIIYLAIICTVAAFAIYMVGLKETDAGESVIYMFIEVVVAFLLGWIILDIIPQTWEIIGAIMITVAVIIVSIKLQKKDSRHFRRRKNEENVREDITEIIQK